MGRDGERGRRLAASGFGLRASDLGPRTLDLGLPATTFAFVIFFRRPLRDAFSFADRLAFHGADVSGVYALLFGFEEAAEDFAGAGLWQRRYEFQTRWRGDWTQFAAHVF